MTTPTISLNSLEKAFPASWCERFTPNPSTSYIDSVFTNLVAEDIISPQDKPFAKFSALPRYFYPFANEEGSSIVLELVCWLFYFDDPFDYGEISNLSGVELLERMNDVLCTGHLPTDPTPTERLCSKFRTRTLNISLNRLEAFNRFITGCSDWLKSIIPIDRRQYEVTPSLQEYKEIRIINAAILPLYPLDEIISELTLEASFVMMPEVVQLGELTAWLIAQCNDIYSFESESKHATQMNSVEIRKIRNCLTLEQAYQEQVIAISQDINEFVAIENSLIDRGIIGKPESLGHEELICPQLDRTRYINGMRSMIIGHHFWSLNDSRYFSLTSPFLELRK